ncbi:hypothetical protein, partial [Pseudomonas savastanoi]|uniref:hypothetical protein n=1 Tax=Pseudomonas savastanoi TaxID=29438 RepID=UPI001CB7AABA
FCSGSLNETPDGVYLRVLSCFLLSVRWTILFRKGNNGANPEKSADRYYLKSVGRSIVPCPPATSFFRFF